MSEDEPKSLRADPACAVVLARLWTLIDGECPSAICEALLRHLDDCERCMGQFSRDARLKLLIATKCGGDRAPKRFRPWRPER